MTPKPPVSPSGEDAHPPTFVTPSSVPHTSLGRYAFGMNRNFELTPFSFPSPISHLPSHPAPNPPPDHPLSPPPSPPRHPPVILRAWPNSPGSTPRNTSKSRPPISLQSAADRPSTPHKPPPPAMATRRF